MSNMAGSVKDEGAYAPNKQGKNRTLKPALGIFMHDDTYVSTLGIGDMGTAFGAGGRMDAIPASMLLGEPLNTLQPLPTVVDKASFPFMLAHNEPPLFHGELFPVPSTSQPIEHQTLSFLSGSAQPVVVQDGKAKSRKRKAQVVKSDMQVKKQKRRCNHNAVERRRRDNINDRIAEIETLLKGRHYTFGHIDERSGKASSSGPSKGETLHKTTMYLRFHRIKEEMLEQEIRDQRSTIAKLVADDVKFDCVEQRLRDMDTVAQTLAQDEVDVRDQEAAVLAQQQQVTDMS